MKPRRKVADNSGDSILSILSFRYLPYWPLFVLLGLTFLSLAVVFTKYITPTYVISATLVLKDKVRGVEESETLQSLNLYAGGKIVENEVLVLQSRTLMRDVVTNLHLYAPVFEKGRIKPASAYLTSPVRVEVQNLNKVKEQPEISFEYNEASNTVHVEGRRHPLGQWITFPYGTLRFVKNPEQKRSTDRSLYFSLVDPRKTTVGLLNNLEVGATSKLSSVVNIKYTDEVPERGEDIVNALIDAYTRASIQNNNQLATNTLSFVTERVNLLEQELDSINRRIQNFRSAEGVVDLSEQGRLYLQNVSENDRKASDLDMQLAALSQVEQHVRSGENRTGIIPTTLGINDPVLTDLLQTLNELELQYANLRRTTGENNPIAQAIQGEIQKIRPNVLSIVRNQRQRLQASRNNLNATSGKFNSLIRNIPRKERELLEISRQQAIKNDVYAFLLQRKEEAELSSASTIADSRVVDRAEASVTPVASKRLFILIGALIASLALGILYILIKEGLTSKILFRSALERGTSIPVVAEIVHVKGRKIPNLPLVPMPVFTAQFKQMQAAMGLFSTGEIKQKILVTSSIEKEGKTFVANQLAMSLASAGQTVLVIDFDLLTPDTSALHDLLDQQGFTDYIKGTATLEQVIYRTGYPNLSVLPTGSMPEDSAEFLLHPDVQDLFASLEPRYDFIILDTSPTEQTTDAYLISKYCDISLLVIRQGKTPETQLQKLERDPALEALPNLSIVFNDVKPRGFLSRYYGYGYGYGYENIPAKKKAFVRS
ncbi:GumC family protein [Rufibacter tibetensis]|uniref:non-specific protein-tyrosine kinase n=1 Tax=Rufibacter tibetensis TaxID=512763 RepID=A0A0P0C6T9_9BACT|nr:polysaccharide biosynthesis tyrosine autokinase [Rufibacter tibetensis]ALJ00984.1 hypothetical protein DC20_20800 [Rufibacter tibetensis]